jgi:hypothetical protein
MELAPVAARLNDDSELSPYGCAALRRAPIRRALIIPEITAPVLWGNADKLGGPVKHYARSHSRPGQLSPVVPRDRRCAHPAEQNQSGYRKVKVCNTVTAGQILQRCVSAENSAASGPRNSRNAVINWWSI